MPWYGKRRFIQSLLTSERSVIIRTYVNCAEGVAYEIFVTNCSAELFYFHLKAICSNCREQSTLDFARLA